MSAQSGSTSAQVRGLAAPLMLLSARARRRPGRWLLPALGITLAVTFAGGVAAQGVIAGDQAARSALNGLSALERTVRVTWQGVVTPDVATRARGLLGGLGLGPQTEVDLLNPVRLSGVIVRPAAIAPLDRWLPRAATGRLGPCAPSRCPMLLAGGGQVPPTLAAAGVRIAVVGSAVLRSDVPLSFAPDIDGNWPVLVTGDVAALDALPGLSGVYRTHSWLASLSTKHLHSWQLASLRARLGRAQAGLLASGSQFSLSAPFGGLEQASSQASAAPERLLLVGGGALASLVLFIALAASGLRGEQLAELERLRVAGARVVQLDLFVAGETGWVCAVALLAGSGGALVAATALALAAGEPIGSVLAHSILTPGAVIALAGTWVVATGLITMTVLARSVRLFDVAAVAAVAALVAGMSIGTTGGHAWTLLLAPLCCLAAGVIAFRGAAWLLRGMERVARRGPVLIRLALVGLARSPALPSLAIAFIAVSIGLGGFALAYRATLLRGVADQAADRVPLDALVSAGPSFVTPLEVAPLARWRAISGGTVLPVERTLASFVSGDGSVTVPALGIPAGGLRLMHGWRSSYSSTPLPALARRLRPAGAVRVPGPLPPASGRWLSLSSADSPGLAVSFTADLRDSQGAIRQLPLGTAGPRPGFLRARLPPGRWEVEALELDEPTGLEITNGHQNGENPAAATQSATRLTLGPLRVLDGARRAVMSVPLGRWRGVGAASSIRSGSLEKSAQVRFSQSGAPGILRPPQPTDSRPVPVLVDPQTASSAGPRGRLELTVDQLPVLARAVGVVRRFPTIAPGAVGFVIADQAVLSSALDAGLPGQGRPDELWVSTPRTTTLRTTLRSGAFAQLSSLFRADLEHQLKATPIARSVLGTLLLATALTGGLAVLGLLLALLGTFRDLRIERDLEEQGIGPRGLRSELRTRLTLASLLGVSAGLLIALLLTRLTVATVAAAGAVSQPQPPLVTVTPWSELVAWSVGAAAVLALAGWLATRWLIAGRRPRRPAGAPGSAEREEPLTEAPAR